MPISSKLTDKHLRNLQAGQSEQIIGDGGGLWIRVLPASKGGALNFYYRFTFAGKERRYNCGTYPNTTLAEARQARNSARDLVEQGVDPVEKEKQDKLTRAAEIAMQKMEKTVQELFEDWYTVYLVVNRKDKGYSVKSSMDLHVLKYFSSLRARDVRIAHVIEVLDRVVKKGKRRTANMLLASIRQMFRHGLARGLVDRDPTLGLSRKQVGGKETSGTRNLSFDEIAELATKLPESGLELRLQAAVALLLATGARPGELCKAKRPEVDVHGGQWRIPAENSKNGREHLIHLSAFAIARMKILLAASDTEFLLAGRKPGESVDDKTLSKAVRDRIRDTPLSNRTQKVGTLMLSAGSWTPHNLRRTFASRLGDLGVDPHIIERCLNHVQEGIVGVYQRQEYMKERKAAFEKIGTKLTKLFAAARKVDVPDPRVSEPRPSAYRVIRQIGQAQPSASN